MLQPPQLQVPRPALTQSFPGTYQNQPSPFVTAASPGTTYGTSLPSSGAGGLGPPPNLFGQGGALASSGSYSRLGIGAGGQAATSPRGMLDTGGSFPSTGPIPTASSNLLSDGRSSFPSLGPMATSNLLSDGRSSFPSLGYGQGSFPNAGNGVGGALGGSGSFQNGNASSSFGGSLLTRRLSNDTSQSMLGSGLFSRTSSNVVMPNFEFKFTPGKSSSASATTYGDIDRLVDAAHATELQPPPRELQAPPRGTDLHRSVTEGAVMPAVVSHPAARGREGVLNRFKHSVTGVYQEPIGCTLQLDDCATACRREVQAIAAECRARGEKYVDPEFPPEPKSLYRNGQAPLITPSRSSSIEEYPATWRRASEGALSAAPSAESRVPIAAGATEELVLAPLGSAALLGALAALRTVGRQPGELIVWREPEAGVYGVIFFKEGEWMYEILDDFLPLDRGLRPACSRSIGRDGETKDWLALVEKAYAKLHSSYETAATSTDSEALEDVLGIGAGHVDMSNFPIWGELWQHLRSKRKRGYVLLASRKREALGDGLTSGLISGFGYPLTRLEIVDGEMLVEMENPWSLGAWHGRWGERSAEMARCHRHLEPMPGSCNPFWMNIQDFCKHFTDVCEARAVSPYWQIASMISSSERPSYPLISVNSKTQALLVLSQPDRRWGNSDQYSNAIGLRVYRSRVVAPPRNTVGVRQNVSSPFRNLELVVARPLTRSRSVVAEVGRLEPTSLYIIAIDSEHKCPFISLRVLTASAPRFRELSSPESAYFLQAQATATVAADSDSFSSQGSAENIDFGGYGGHDRDIGMQDPSYDMGYEEEEDSGNHIKVTRMLQDWIASCGGSLRC